MLKYTRKKFTSQMKLNELVGERKFSFDKFGSFFYKASTGPYGKFRFFH